MPDQGAQEDVVVENGQHGPVRRLIERVLPKGRFARGFTVLAGGTATAQAIALAASPVLTRLFTPVDFGMLAVFSSLLATINVVTGLRYELAIPLPEDDDTAKHVLGLTLGIVVLMSVLVGVLALLFGKPITAALDTPDLSQHLWLLPVGTLALGLYQTFNYWAIRRGAYGRIARTKLAQGITATVIQLGSGFAGIGPFGLLVGQVSGHAAGTSSLAGLAYGKDRFRLRDLHVKTVREVAVRYRRFPLFSSGAGLLNAAGLRLPTLLFAGLYGAGVAGLFALTARVLAAPVTLIGQSMSQVYFGEMSKLRTSNPAAMYPLFLRLVKRLAMAGALPLLVITVAGPPLFSLLFGPEWREAGQYAQIAAVMYFVQLVTSPLSLTLTVLERQDLQLAWDALRLALVGGGIAAAWALGYGAVVAVGAYAVAMALAYVLRLVVTAVLLKRAGQESV